MSTFQSDFPAGSYTISAGNVSGTQSGTIAYGGTAFYTSTIPALTGNTYSSMQGMNASNAFTLDVNSFTPNSNTTPGSAWTFFTVYLASTGAAVWSDDFLSPTTTSLMIPAGTLLAGTNYDFELNFDNRLDGTDINGLATQQLFDMRTDETFFTSTSTVPEPSAWLLMAGGLSLFLLLKKRLTLRGVVKD